MSEIFETLLPGGVAAMTPFEHFSEEISKLAESHAASKLARLICRIEYLRRRYWTNRPYPFVLVKEDEGKPVGEPIDIYHLRLYEMEYAARSQLTEQVILNGLRANAYSVIHSQGIDMPRKTTIQPRWI